MFGFQESINLTLESAQSAKVLSGMINYDQSPKRIIVKFQNL